MTRLSFLTKISNTPNIDITTKLCFPVLYSYMNSYLSDTAELGIDSFFLVSITDNPIVGFLSPIIDPLLLYHFIIRLVCLIFCIFHVFFSSFFNVFTVQTSFLPSIQRSFVTFLSIVILSVPRVILFSILFLSLLHHFSYTLSLPHHSSFNRHPLLYQHLTLMLHYTS